MNTKVRQSVNKIKGSGKTHAHKIQTDNVYVKRVKVVSQRDKGSTKEKRLRSSFIKYIKDI